MTDTTLEPEPTHATVAPGQRARRIGAALWRRWPTWLGLAFAAANLAGAGAGDGGGAGGGREFAAIVVLAALTYLIAAVIDRPRAVWAVVAALTGVLALAKLIDAVEAAWVLTALGPAVAAIALVTGRLRGPGRVAWQGLGVLAFGAAALGGLQLSPAAASCLIAAALIAHAAWDAWHWYTDSVVARSYAEWCGVYDLAVGVALLALVVAA